MTPIRTEDETEKAIEMLTDLLSVLGWSVELPPEGTYIKGLIIGDDEYLESWEELRANRNDKGMN